MLQKYIKTTIKSYVRKISVITLLVVAVSCFIFAQEGLNKYLFIPPKEQPKTFLELLFDINENPYITKEKSRPKEDNTSQYKAKTEQDTSRKDNRIVSLRDGGDKFLLYLEILDHESQIEINIYNMLGKNVLEVYKGTPKPNGVPYDIIISGPNALPNGPYLCVVVGRNFRLPQKFIVMRR